jgi:hypothetical protein
MLAKDAKAVQAARRVGKATVRVFFFKGTADLITALSGHPSKLKMTA